MQIKLWHKLLFVGSIGAFVIYINRQTLMMGGRYLKQKFGDLVNSFASSWVGVKEIGDNKAFANKVFEEMMRVVGWRSNEQWCMYFAKAIHYQALQKNPTEQAKVKKILTGSSQLSFSNAKNDTTGTYTTSTTPKVGDIVVFQHKNSPSTGHAGVVVKVNNDNTINTIEGNTSDKSISNGELVSKKVRTSVVGNSIGGDLVVRGYIRKLNV
jgi:hypothetical protein